MIASPIVDIPTYHPIKASREHNAHIIRVIDAFVNRKANDIDIIKTNADAKIDEDASPISSRRRRRRTMHKRPSTQSRRPGNTAVSPFVLHAINTTYSIQSHTMPTHFILSIHLGPCLEQHPACDLVATRGSEMERGVLALRYGGWGWYVLRGNIFVVDGGAK